MGDKPPMCSPGLPQTPWLSLSLMRTRESTPQWSGGSSPRVSTWPWRPREWGRRVCSAELWRRGWHNWVATLVLILVLCLILKCKLLQDTFHCLFVLSGSFVKWLAGAEDQRTAQRDKSCEAIKYLCQQHRTIIAGIQRICFSHTGLAMAVIDMNFISCSEQLMAALVSLAHLTWHSELNFSLNTEYIRFKHSSNPILPQERKWLWDQFSFEM